MFAILQITKSNSFFPKLRIHNQRIILPNDEAFFNISVETSRSIKSLKKLENCLGILKKDVIINGNTALPDNCGISLFLPDILPGLLLINSAADKLKKRRFRSLILYDEKGIYPDYIDKLIDSFGRIRVITPSPKKYNSAVRRLMENYGFSLEISTTADFEGDVIISDSCCVPLYYSGTVFTNEKKYLMNAEIFSGSEINLPEFYENIRPNNVSSLLFASALYEKCGVTELGKLKYTDFGC